MWALLKPIAMGPHAHPDADPAIPGVAHSDSPQRTVHRDTGRHDTVDRVANEVQAALISFRENFKTNFGCRRNSDLTCT